MQEPNKEADIYHSNIAEQPTLLDFGSSISMSANERHTSTDTMSATASSSVFSPSKLSENDKLIVSIPISILQNVPKPSSFFNQTTVSVSVCVTV